MYDAKKIFVGIVAFVAVVTLPIWYSFAAGDPSHAPELQKPEGRCVEDTAHMRAYHMDMLDDWRDQVVRNGERVYTASDGRRHWMSLSNLDHVAGHEVHSRSCMGCHASKEKFCDECHSYVGVSPYCFDCHVEPPREM